MPIKFRCMYCGQLLGIARRKAGTVVGCPKCDRSVMVPQESESDQSRPVSAPVFEAEGFGAWIEGTPPARGPAGPAGAVAPPMPGPPMPGPSVPMGEPGRGGRIDRPAPPEPDSRRGPAPAPEPVRLGHGPPSAAPAARPAAETLDQLVWVDGDAGRVVLVTICLMVAAFTVGMAVGRYSFPWSPPPTTPANGAAPRGVVAPPAVPAPAAEEPRNPAAPAAANFTGLIQFTEGGRRHPDVGATVIVVPTDRSNPAPAALPARGLRPGDVNLADQPGLEGLRARGGAVGFADAEGRVSLAPNAAGLSVVLLVSSHLPRDTNEDLSEIRLLQQIFQNYTDVVGDRKYIVIHEDLQPGKEAHIEWMFTAGL